MKAVTEEQAKEVMRLIGRTDSADISALLLGMYFYRADPEMWSMVIKALPMSLAAFQQQADQLTAEIQEWLDE